MAFDLDDEELEATRKLNGVNRMNKTEMKKQIEQLDKEIDSKIAEKVRLQEKYFKLYDLQEIKKKYLGKYYIYRDNCYSCPSENSDYWNVYYKVIDVDESGAIKAVSLQKDKYGKIVSGIDVIGVGSLHLDEITEKEYIRETSKILGILQERYKV